MAVVVQNSFDFSNVSDVSKNKIESAISTMKPWTLF